MNGPDGGRTTGIRAWIESTKSAGLSDGARKRLRILAIPMAARSSRSNRSSTNASGFAATILCGAQCGGREILQIDRNDQFSPRVKGRRQYVPIVRIGQTQRSNEAFEAGNRGRLRMSIIRESASPAAFP